MTKEMREFLTAWLSWATSGDLKSHQYGRTFTPATGLCAAVAYWTVGGHAHPALISEFEAMLGDDKLYPFDTPQTYDAAARRRTQHLNPARLAWVRAKLEVSDE